VVVGSLVVVGSVVTERSFILGQQEAEVHVVVAVDDVQERPGRHLGQAFDHPAAGRAHCEHWAMRLPEHGGGGVVECRKRYSFPGERSVAVVREPPLALVSCLSRTVSLLTLPWDDDVKKLWRSATAHPDKCDTELSRSEQQAYDPGRPAHRRSLVLLARHRPTTFLTPFPPGAGCSTWSRARFCAIRRVTAEPTERRTIRKGRWPFWLLISRHAHASALVVKGGPARSRLCRAEGRSTRC
jgi:hypothetical protein